MIELPDFDKSFDYENDFYLSCQVARMSKILAHYELFKMSLELPGAIVECGVFKGASLARFAMMRQLFGGALSKTIIGFDTFGRVPDADEPEYEKFRARLVEDSGTEEGISVEQLQDVLAHKGTSENVRLISGDVCETVPRFCEDNPQLKISLLNIDTCSYESCQTILEHFYPRMVRGGVVILDDYAALEGETRADDEFFADLDIVIRKQPFAKSPCYAIKP